MSAAAGFFLGRLFGNEEGQAIANSQAREVMRQEAERRDLHKKQELKTDLKFKVQDDVKPA
jgi:hypothetical protein